MATLTVTRFGSKHEFAHASVKAAAKSACAQVENNDAAPVNIKENGVVVWENAGPFDVSYDKLRELAGIQDDDV